MTEQRSTQEIVEVDQTGIGLKGTHVVVEVDVPVMALIDPIGSLLGFFGV